MTGKTNEFKNEQVLEVIGELWKTKAVEMMKGEEHASEKVLFGFCAFHHLLLAFASTIPYVFFYYFFFYFFFLFFFLFFLFFFYFFSIFFIIFFYY